MVNESTNDKILNGRIVENCNSNRAKGFKYFHPENFELIERFKWIYKIFNLNDTKVSEKIGIDVSTMSRYRRGIFYPTNQMKMLIAKAISELSKYPIDSAQVWGEDLIFEDWKENKRKINEVDENAND